MEAEIVSGSKAARVLVAGLMMLGASTAFGQSNPLVWESETLNMRFAYPTDFVQRDATAAMHDGHLTIFGISGDADPELAAATHCLKPDLLVELPGSDVSQTTSSKPAADGSTQVTITPSPTGTILLAELDIDCLTPEQQVKAHDLQAGMAEVVNKVPGMRSIMTPSWYTIGWQKVHVAAAQGQPQSQAGGQVGPLQLFTMGIATNWNSHILVWYFSSNSVALLDRMTKSTVRFGRAKAESLYPVTIGNAGSASR